MKHLVIGLGEVGTAIQSILQCDGYDSKGIVVPTGEFDVLHICFPWSEDFVKNVVAYRNMFAKQGDLLVNLIIVHSSVPVGTCDTYGWVHSPIRGVHPNLELGIRTFVKYFGGKNKKDVYASAESFREQGIFCHEIENARTTEALKLWDTTQYGMMILIQKEIYKYCEKEGLDPEIIYTDANHTYAIGYEALNRPEVVRPYLKNIPGPIGGHCVIPNAHLLKSSIAKDLIAYNDELKNMQE